MRKHGVHCSLHGYVYGEGEREISSAKRQRSQAGTRRMKNQSFGSRRFSDQDFIFVLCLARQPGFGDGSNKVVGTWKLAHDPEKWAPVFHRDKRKSAFARRS